MLKYKALACLAAFALVLYAFFARSPEGFFADFVWPIAYCTVAAATLLVAFRPSQSSLRIWASLLISTEVLRALSNALAEDDPERWSRFGIHTKMAVLAYFVWVGWRYLLPSSYGKGES